MLQEKLFVTENNKEYTLIIGQNAHENDLIRKGKHPLDIWFHLHNVPSCHIILESRGDNIPKRYLYTIQQLLLKYTPRAPLNVKTIYTEIRYIKNTPTPGSVITKKYHIL
jgi:predicted ribosome quality control (RQC) complex YloA/Tae2 family protein